MRKILSGNVVDISVGGARITRGFRLGDSVRFVDNAMYWGVIAKLTEDEAGNQVAMLEGLSPALMLICPRTEDGVSYTGEPLSNLSLVAE
jgi:hypothetical protein